MILDNATVVTVDERRRIFVRGAVAIDGNRIAAVGPSHVVRARFPDDPAVVDQRGNLVLPGFVDGHVHLPQSLLRGCSDDIPLATMLAGRVWPLQGHFTPEDARIAVQVAALEMLKCGTTTFLETLVAERYHFESLIDCVAATRMRAVLPRVVMDQALYSDDASSLHPGMREDPETGVREALAMAEQWAGSDQIKIWFGPRSTGGCSEDLLKRLADLARKHGIGICLHYAQGDGQEREYIRSRYGCGLGEFLHRVGIVGPHVVLVHCVHLGPEDIDLLRDTGTSIVHCPSPASKYGMGIAPIPEMLAAGLNVALGCDSSCSNNSRDMIRDMKLASYLQKARLRNPTVMPAETMLEMATVNGARAIGMSHLIGSLEEGKRADLIVVNVDQPHWIPLLNPVSNLVFAGTGADVETVIIDGRTVMEKRQVKTIDEERVLWEARRRIERLYARSGVTVPQRWPVE